MFIIETGFGLGTLNSIQLIHSQTQGSEIAIFQAYGIDDIPEIDFFEYPISKEAVCIDISMEDDQQSNEKITNMLKALGFKKIIVLYRIKN